MIERKQAAASSPEDITGTEARISPLAALSLRSSRVTIGPVLPADTGAIFLWLNDVESVVLDLPYRPMDWMSYNSWLENFGKNPSQILFAIRPMLDSRIIGFLVFTKIDSIHRSAECGIRIGSKSERGKGYGKEAIRLALDYAWKHLNLNRVQLSVFASNSCAIGAYQAAGFQREGMLRQAAFINGQWTDVVLMGALRP